MTPVVKLENLTKVFGSNRVVDSLNLEIYDGEFITFLGPSGCGKTTTLRMIAGFYASDAGNIMLNGRIVNDLPPNKRDTAMVFQDYALFPHMTVFDNVAYGLKLKKLSRDEIRQKVEQSLAMVQLEGMGERYPSQLSGGQQQRVALARALVMNPIVLLLDEPLSNLDAKLRDDVRAELRMIQKQTGITTIYVTHDQQEALAMSDKIAVMNKGRVEQFGTPDEIYFNPKTRFVADFVGTTNGFEGMVTTVHARSTFRFDGGGHVELSDNVPPGRAFLSIRPEFISIDRKQDKDSTDGRCVFSGRIKQVLFGGEKTRYYVDSLGKEWIVDVSGKKDILAEGEEVSLYVAPEDMIVIRE